MSKPTCDIIYHEDRQTVTVFVNGKFQTEGSWCWPSDVYHDGQYTLFLGRDEFGKKRDLPATKGQWIYLDTIYAVFNYLRWREQS